MCKDVMIIKSQDIGAEGEVVSAFTPGYAVQGRREFCLECPDCGGIRFISNGRTYKGRRNYKCQGCGRQISYIRPPVSFEARRVMRLLAQQGVKPATLSKALGLSRARVLSICKKEDL